MRRALSPGKGFSDGTSSAIGQPERVYAAAGRQEAGRDGLHPWGSLHHGRGRQLLLRPKLPHGTGIV